MLNKLTKLGNHSLSRIQVFGHAGIFLLKILVQPPALKCLFEELKAHLYFIGMLSCLVISVSALFIGMVLGLEGYHTLEKFGASSHLGQLLALSIIRELGPVISALLFAGCAGSAITAEIGLMQATEQLASMDMMGIDPLRRVIYPRFLAGVIALPVLSLIFMLVAIYGGYFVGVQCLGVDDGIFWSNMQASLNLSLDFIDSLVKTVIFATVVVWIAVFQGFYCVATARGISQATTTTVVYSSVAVLGLDFLLTAIMIGGW